MKTLSREFGIVPLLLCLAAPAAFGESEPSDVFQGNGIKIGETGPRRTIIWTRLTAAPERAAGGIAVVGNREITPETDPAGLVDAVPGAPGEIRVEYWPEGRKSDGKETGWQRVAPERDFIRQFKLDNLLPGTAYRVRSHCRSGAGNEGPAVEGSFRTAPGPEDSARVLFTVVTGQGFHRRDDREKGHLIYPQMGRLDPDFFVHTGDIVYYDKPDPRALSAALARYHWNRMYALPCQRDFHNRVSSYFIKDDHDTLINDCWPGMDTNQMGNFTFKEGLAVFREQVPMGEKTFRTFRWGKHLQIWMPEGRDFRSSNKMSDGSGKTIWGKEQMDWFEKSVKASEATFRLLVSPTPVVGPDRKNKNDNHANRGFAYEGKTIRKFIASQKNMFVVCGDRHWQYVSEDPETGVREYSCGPTSDIHAGGFSTKQRTKMHRYLNVVGGFLSVTVEPGEKGASITFNHHGVNGKVLNSESHSE